MKFIRFIGWLAAAISVMLVAGSLVHMMFSQFMPMLGIDGNRATAGGYSMEVFVSAFSFILVAWRILWALEVVKNADAFWKLIKTRAAILSFTLAAIIGMTLTNRMFWWVKHMFTDEAFDQVIYTNAANSVIISFLLCVLVYAVNADPETERQKSGISSGLSIAVSLWGIGCIAFVVGLIMYPGRAALAG